MYEFKQREIKFRAWDVRNKQMINYVFVADGYVEYDVEQFGTFEKYIPLQYTGLKDKNGKEIYEGDIIRILYSDWVSKSQADTRTLQQYLIDIAKIGKVVFEDCKFGVKFKAEYVNSIYPGTHGYIEVIGNIFANPDLLEVKN